jgi:hypothetical protein
MRSFFAALFVLVACDSETLGGEGASCETDAECEAGLECDDAHTPKTCEVPHDHPSDGGAGAGGAPTSGGAPSTGGAGGGEPSLCDAYCGCMSESCASYDAYPFADEAACLSACEAFTTEELSCFGGFCEQASGAPSEHLCEHAWGALGTKEC